MKTLQSVLIAGTTIDNLLSAYAATAIDYVNGHEVETKKYPPDQYPGHYLRADARKAVYDAAHKAKDAAQALDDANAELIAALREMRRLL